VVGVRGHSHTNSNAIGTQLEALIRSMHRPVLVVNCEFKTPATFMLAYDGSAASLRALDIIAAQSELAQFDWVLSHSHANSADKTLQAAEIKLSHAGFGKLTLDVRQSDPENAFIECQQHNNVDVTVMGAFSHHPLRGFIFGSFTEKMLKRTNKPLLLIH